MAKKEIQPTASTAAVSTPMATNSTTITMTMKLSCSVQAFEISRDLSWMTVRPMVPMSMEGKTPGRSPHEFGLDDIQPPYAAGEHPEKFPSSQ